MGAIRDFLRHFRKGDPVSKVCDTVNLNRIANILEDIQGIGCRIDKPTNAEGKGWTIVVDGSTDIAPDGYTGSSGGLPPEGYQYQVLSKNSDTDGDADWDWMRYVVPSS